MTTGRINQVTISIQQDPWGSSQGKVCYSHWLVPRSLRQVPLSHCWRQVPKAKHFQISHSQVLSSVTLTGVKDQNHSEDCQTVTPLLAKYRDAPPNVSGQVLTNGKKFTIPHLQNEALEQQSDLVRVHLVRNRMLNPSLHVFFCSRLI